MYVVITFLYAIFTVCVLYPPTEFAAVGLTIPGVFDHYLGSENLNFVFYHMDRIILTMLVHSVLPLGYTYSLWMGGVQSKWLMYLTCLAMFVPFIVGLWVMYLFGRNAKKNPLAKQLKRYTHEGADWSAIAVDINREYRSVDKVIIPLSTTGRFVATTNWFLKVSQYHVIIVNQADCTLVAVGTDIFNLTPVGEDGLQYVTIQAIPSSDDLPKFTFRVTTAALRELQPRLVNQVHIPGHLKLEESQIDRFLTVFKQQVDQNPPYKINEVPELCMGCMQAESDVKIHRSCDLYEPQEDAGDEEECQICNCKVLWCWSCMGRWYATRVPQSDWLEAQATCPVCRARFCVLDVCPVVVER